MMSRNFLSLMLITVSLGLSVLACGPITTGQSGGGTTSMPVGKDISGTYSVTGVNLDNNNYTGEVTLTSAGNNRYTLNWTIGAGTQTGTGTLSGDTLTSTWGDGTNSGDVTYTLQPDGSLSGTWTQKGQSGTGTETLTLKK